MIVLVTNENTIKIIIFKLLYLGINVKSVLNSAAMVKKKFDKGTRSVQVQKAANHLIEALEMQKELKTCKSSIQHSLTSYSSQFRFDQHRQKKRLLLDRIISLHETALCTKRSSAIRDFEPIFGPTIHVLGPWNIEGSHRGTVVGRVWTLPQSYAV